jgi:3-oxoacyl-[acyl-carrier protein] reductase
MKKTALIIGGSRGIGRAVSIRLARDGFGVLINYRQNDTQAKKTKQEIENGGGTALLHKFDIADTKTAAAEMERIVASHAIHTCVFSAGIRRDESFLFLSEEQWQEVLDINLRSFRTIIQPVAQQMVLARNGRIIVVSSTSGESGSPGQVPYAASKAGLIAAVKSLALECAKRNVLVNAITPGFIDTDMTGDLPREDIIKRIPLKRLGSADDVAGVVSFLASNDARYITGEVIRVNGGIYT